MDPIEPLCSPVVGGFDHSSRSFFGKLHFEHERFDRPHAEVPAAVKSGVMPPSLEVE